MSSPIISFVWDFFSRAPGIKTVLDYANEIVLSAIRTGPIPKHVAFIMDGNRRFAKNNKLSLESGHSAGARTLVSIEEVSVYAFSIENFNRSQVEVDTLFKLLRERLKIITDQENQSALSLSQIRVRLIGNRSMVPPDVLQDIEKIEQQTKDYTRGVLNICAPYTSRDEIVHSIKDISEKVAEGSLPETEIDPGKISDHFYYGQSSHHVDVLVRTSGHTRLSDFLLWQCNENSAIYFVDTLWPDFSHLELLRILFHWSYHRMLNLTNKNYSADIGATKKLNLETLVPVPPLVSVTKR